MQPKARSAPAIRQLEGQALMDSAAQQASRPDPESPGSLSHRFQAATRFLRYALHSLSYLLLCLLNACSVPGPSNPIPTRAESFQVQDKITLVFWHAWPSPEQYILATLVDQYNQSHPGTQVIAQAMPLASLTNELRVAGLVGSGPHLVLLQSHTLGALAQDGLLLPIDDLLLPSSERDTLLPTVLESAQSWDSQGVSHLYGVPLTFDTLALYYNKGQVEAPPETTDDLLNQARLLTDLNQQPPVWGLAYTLSLDKTIAYLPAFEGRIFDEAGQVILGSTGRLGTERWLQWLFDLRQDDKILAVSDSIAVESAIKAQEGLMTIDWSHALSEYQELWGEKLGVAPLPRLSSTGLPPQPYVQSDVLSINARVVDVTEQQAAADFVRYLLSAGAQQAFLEAGKQPVLLGLSLDGDTHELEAARIFRLQAGHGQAMPNSRSVDEVVRTEFERMLQSVLRGLSTPADAVTYTDGVLRERFGAHPPH